MKGLLREPGLGKSDVERVGRGQEDSERRWKTFRVRRESVTSSGLRMLSHVQGDVTQVMQVEPTPQGRQNQDGNAKIIET